MMKQVANPTTGRRIMVMGLAGSAVLLASCSDGSSTDYRGDEMLPNGLSIKEMIEARQHNLKDLGGAYKTVNDQLKQDQPNLQEIGFATAEVKNHAYEIGNWFPEGTGPDAGVPTEALPAIWTDAEAFSDQVSQFRNAAIALDDAAKSGDMSAIAGASPPVGKTCKTCHDSFRLDD